MRLLKTTTTVAPTFASESSCRTDALSERAMRQTRPPERCGSATATSSPALVATVA